MRPLPGVQNWEKSNPTKSSFIRKKKRFCLLQPYLVWKFCLTDHEKQVQKFVAYWKVCQKSSQREVIRKNSYKASKPQRVLLPALLLKFSRSLTNVQASPGRQRSLRSKDRCPNHAVVLIAAGIERWQTVHFQLSKPDTKTRTAYNATAGREDGGKRNFRGPKRQLFLQNKGFFKASTWSLIIQLHAREKWRHWGNHNYQKIRLECTQVAIDRNRSMASQRVKKSLSVPIMPCSRALFNVRNRALPETRLHVGSSIDRWIRKCQPPRASCHTTKPADRCARGQQLSVDSRLQSQAASETNVALFRPSWKRKPFLIFVFRIWSQRMFTRSHRCAWSSGFRRKVATAPSFLVAKPRVPVAKCDYAPGFFEPCSSIDHLLPPLVELTRTNKGSNLFFAIAWSTGHA